MDSVVAKKNIIMAGDSRVVGVRARMRASEDRDRVWVTLDVFAVDFGRQQPIMMPKNENAFELREQTVPNMMVEL